MNRGANRRHVFLAWLLVIPIGLALKFYPGPGRWFVNNWLSAIPYEVFFILLVFWVTPRRRSMTTVAVGVCLGTCVLEFLQLWQPVWLQAVRSTIPGRLVLGTTFMWSDLPAYPLGCFIGWLLMRWLVSVRAHGSGAAVEDIHTSSNGAG